MHKIIFLSYNVRVKSHVPHTFKIIKKTLFLKHVQFIQITTSFNLVSIMFELGIMMFERKPT